MAGTIQRNRIRHTVDPILNRTGGFTDVLTNSADVKFWQAEDVQVEVGLYYNGTFAADITNVTSITLEMKAPDNLLGSPLVSKTATLDLTADSATWLAGTKQHALFVMTNLEMNIQLAGAKSKELLLFYWIITNDATPRRIPLGRASITLLDSGYGDVGAITVVPNGARIHNNKLQVLNQSDSKYYDFVFRTLSGEVVSSIEGPGES